MFRNHRSSSYTGLACTFSFLIREHGVEPIYDLVLDTAKACSATDKHLSDALASLAIAISSSKVRRAADGVPRVKKIWRKKTEVRLEAWDALLQVADKISYKNLEFFKLLEIPTIPMGHPQRSRFIITEPVVTIDERLEKFSQTLEDEFSWYPFEKFVTSEFPSLIERQMEYYDQLVSIVQSVDDERAPYPFSILKVRKGSVHEIAELGKHFEHARAELKKFNSALKKYEEALQSELNGGRLWDSARHEIEKGLPDQLGHIIKYETIKAIEEKADNLIKEG